MTNNEIKSLLLLVDVQYDFINGSLAVEGAPSMMDALANYIKVQPQDAFHTIVMTADYHPYELCKGGNDYHNVVSS